MNLTENENEEKDKAEEFFEAMKVSSNVDVDSSVSKVKAKMLKSNAIWNELKDMDEERPEEDDLHGDYSRVNKKGKVVHDGLDLDRLGQDMDRFAELMGGADHLKRKRNEIQSILEYKTDGQANDHEFQENDNENNNDQA
eukprot:CAMPEP_0116928040 /NCGR_PEP_ID=MMETSP0467-20121206/25737_1 /TAXON_ID=283647 /ORGANISM="Mesodinium pulex, Strain SPMC105" /LENGTH=139 /DNA_ID=CAMNT_0004607719 /DNA_START=461 /DNA_END=880 /DNA_ORIENTATION=-